MRIMRWITAACLWAVAAAAPAIAESDLRKPTLYALVVGISDYAERDLRLTFAAKDAHDFAAALANQQGGLYGKVVVRTITDRLATAAEIRDGLDWLTKQVTSRDTGLVYLAGHGLFDERDRFYFLAADSDAARLRATAVPRTDIQEALDALAGKAVLFLDASHGGAMDARGGRRGSPDINAILNEFSSTERGVVVFAASTGRQVSQESPTWKGGAFSRALVEGIGLPGQPGMADLLGTGTITISSLDLYLRERVRTLTEGRQSPVTIRPATVPDFPFALARP